MKRLTEIDAKELVETRKFLTFIWAGQTGFFELDADPRHRALWSREQALANVAGKTLFAPLARKRRGSTKKDVATSGNVLWADIDSRDALGQVEDCLLPLGLRPSVVVDSGNKGYWVYFKLSQVISTDEIEARNRGLAALLEADHCGNRDRLARLPNSLHPESERFARIVEFAGTSYPIEAFADISLPPPHRIEVSTDPTPIDDQPVRLTLLPGYPILGPHLWNYIRIKPSRGQGYDRHAEEQRIFTALTRQGWSDTEIIQFANQACLPRHTQEKQRRGDYSWTLHSIENARLYLEEEDRNTSSKYLSPMCERSATYHTLDRQVVLTFVNGQTTEELVQAVRAAEGCSRTAVLRALRQLRAGGYVDRRRDGKFVFNHLTEKGRKALDSRFRKALILPTLESLKVGNSRRRLW